MLRIISAFILTLAVASSAFAQSTAINGTIEGTVKDEQGSLLPGVTVTVTNIETGDSRSVVTNERGLYRAPLLSLGTYRIGAELQGFKKFEQTGVTLLAGQTAVIDVNLSVGAVAETITVTADSPIVDLANRRLPDRHLRIGPSYFMRPNLDRAAFECIWAHSVLPYI